MATSAADGNQAAEHPDAPVVVGVDGSEHAERALRWAIREAALRDAALTLVHAYRDAGITTASVAAARELGHRLVDDIAARHRGMLDELSGCDTVVAAHDAAQLLLDVGRRAQLIVMGTRGLGLFGELLLSLRFVGVTRATVGTGDLLVAYGAGLSATLLPVLRSGVGTAELIYLRVLDVGIAGQVRDAVAAAAFTQRVFTWVIPVVIGLVVLVDWVVRRGRRPVDRTAAGR